MFAKAIGHNPLTTDVAAEMFNNIKAIDFKEDRSFFSTMVALFGDRLGNGEQVIVSRTESSFSYNAMKDCSEATLFNAILDSGLKIRKTNRTGIIHVHNFYNGDEQADNFAADFIRKKMEKYIPGFQEVEDLRAFCKTNKIEASFHLNDDRKSCLILVNKLDVKKWHFIQSLLPRIMPWFFAEKPLTAIEFSLLKSLTKRRPEEYERAIEDIAKKFDFREAKIRKQLNGFETRFVERELQEVRDKNEGLRRAIRDLDYTFENYYRELEDGVVKELGLIEKIRQVGDNSEIMEYFVCNKTLNLESVNGTDITFVVSTHLASWDPDIFEIVIGNKNSFFYRDYIHHERYTDNFSDEQIEKLMVAIFGEEVLKLRVYAAYKIRCATGGYEAIRHFAYPEYLKDHTPNQHIWYYACLGGNETYIRGAMMKHDYIGAIDYCIASATNFNMSEANTGTFFMEKILADDAGRFIELPDGTCVTPMEAVQWLESRENKEGE